MIVFTAQGLLWSLNVRCIEINDKLGCFYNKGLNFNNNRVKSWIFLIPGFYFIFAGFDMVYSTSN